MGHSYPTMCTRNSIAFVLWQAAILSSTPLHPQIRLIHRSRRRPWDIALRHQPIPQIKTSPPTLCRRPAQGKAGLSRPNQAIVMLPNATLRVFRVGQPYNQHLWLLRQPHNLDQKLSPRGLRGSTRVNSMLDPWVSQPHPNWILGQCSDCRRNMAAIPIQFW